MVRDGCCLKRALTAQLESQLPAAAVFRWRCLSIRTEWWRGRYTISSQKRRDGESCNGRAEGIGQMGQSRRTSLPAAEIGGKETSLSIPKHESIRPKKEHMKPSPFCENNFLFCKSLSTLNFCPEFSVNFHSHPPLPFVWR